MANRTQGGTLPHKTSTQALNPMVREKWVVITSGMDARSPTAVITRKGHVLLKKAGQQWEKVQTRVAEAFGRREWTAFVANVEKLRLCAEGDDKASI